MLKYIILKGVFFGRFASFNNRYDLTNRTGQFLLSNNRLLSSIHWRDEWSNRRAMRRFESIHHSAYTLFYGLKSRRILLADAWWIAKRDPHKSAPHGNRIESYDNNISADPVPENVWKKWRERMDPLIYALYCTSIQRWVCTLISQLSTRQVKFIAIEAQCLLKS
jgi:hypothetical protein